MSPGGTPTIDPRTPNPPYDAYWVPGRYDRAVDDDALAVALDWLGRANYPGQPVVAMNAKKMMTNRRLLARAAQRFEFVSPQSRSGPGGAGTRAVLAVWPNDRTLDLAEALAQQGGLCVVPGRSYDVTGWIHRTSAVNLLRPEDPPLERPEVDEGVQDTIGSICSFGGHNRFSGGEDKTVAIKELRAMVQNGHRPDPAVVEQYAVATGETDPEGASRLRKYYEAVLDGRRFGDYGGRFI